MIRFRSPSRIGFAILWLAAASSPLLPAQETAKPPAAPSGTAKPAASSEGSAPKIELNLPNVGGPMTSPPKPKEPAADDLVGQLLFSVGIDDALLGKFQDARPLDAAERSPLVGLLSSIRPFRPVEIEEVVQVAERPSAFAVGQARGKFWQVAGRLKSITIEEFTDAELDRVYAELPDMPRGDLRRFFFRSEVEFGNRTVTVVSLRMPEMLLSKYLLPKQPPQTDDASKAEPAPASGEAPKPKEQPKLADFLKVGEVIKVDENVGIGGLYIKSLAAAADERPVLVTKRPAWYPDTPLGKLGMDYGLYDDAPLMSFEKVEDPESFFQLMAAFKRAKWEELLDETAENYSVVPLFNDAKAMRGKLVALRGIARRATLVNVPYPDVQRRFGIKQYYLVDIFTADSRDNPLIFALTKLPPGFPQGDDIHVEVRIPGSFITGFGYARDATTQELEKGVKPPAQKAPLLIGKELYRYADKTAAGETFDWYVSGLVGIGAIAMGVVGWLTMRGDRKTRKIMEQTNAPQTSLNDLKGDFKNGPDFSNLE